MAVLALRRFNLVLATGLPLLQVLGMFLTATTYRFFSEERAKRKARESFSRFLAPAIVDEVLGREGSLQLGGEKRELTALFADIRGFTTISERLDPHRLLELLNQYLTPMTDVIVSRHQGTLDKYMGDAIMAFWGAPQAQPDHALRACRAALDMLAELERLRQGWRAAGLPDIDIGIGLNTGPMSVGFVGSQDRFYNYTILGDAVNLASRLEGANKQYGTRIIIGPADLRAGAGAGGGAAARPGPRQGEARAGPHLRAAGDGAGLRRPQAAFLEAFALGLRRVAGAALGRGHGPLPRGRSAPRRRRVLPGLPGALRADAARAARAGLGRRLHHGEQVNGAAFKGAWRLDLSLTARSHVG